MRKDKLHDEIAGAMARGYCSPKNKKKNLDANLIDAMTDEVMEVIRKMVDHNSLANLTTGGKVEKICPIRPIVYNDLPINQKEATCIDNCAWFVKGECAVVIAARGHLEFIDSPIIEASKCDMENWSSGDDEDQNYAG